MRRRREGHPGARCCGTQHGPTSLVSARSRRRSVVGAGFALPRDAGRRPALHVRLAGRSVVSRSRAMPVGDRRSTVRLVVGAVVGAGFALPRDAGRRPALHREIGVAQRRWAGFALPRDAGRRPALHVRLGWRSVVGAGFALPRDAGRRPALHVRLGWRGVVGAGFALPRDAGRRPALHREIGAMWRPALHRELLVRVSRSRAMPVGDRRSTVRLAWRSVVGAGFALPRDAGRRPARSIGVAQRCWCGFRAPARCGARCWWRFRRSRVDCGGAGRRPALHREIGVAQRRWCGFRAPARCRSETGAPREIGVAQRRVSRSRAMPVGDRRST